MRVRYPTTERLKIAQQLEAISNGALVGLDWGLQTFGGDNYTGKIAISSEPDTL